MCTALSYDTRDHYFGRNLDLEGTFGESVTVTPRNFPLHFRKTGVYVNHFAIIGMAHVAEGYPLYYDAVNERGLGMAALNFPGNACYQARQEGKIPVAPFELIPWILHQCATVAEARRQLERLTVVAEPFNDRLPLTPLHWILDDREETLVVEPLASGLQVWDNPVRVLTNNPPFDRQLFQLQHYMHLSNRPAENRLCPQLSLQPYSRGMGAIGMPGDLSSASRFVRAVFTRQNAVSGDAEPESVSQFFHILQSVEQQRGCVDLGGGKYEMTVYSACCNASKGIYYYTTYENRQITAVELHREKLDGSHLVSYPLITEQQIRLQNGGR